MTVTEHLIFIRTVHRLHKWDGLASVPVVDSLLMFWLARVSEGDRCWGKDVDFRRLWCSGRFAGRGACCGMGDLAETGAVSTKVRGTSESLRAEILAWISDDRRARAVFEELEKTIAVLERRVHRNNKQIRATHDEILRLSGLFCVVQVLLFLGVAQPNVLECRNLWAPFLLSALSSIVAFRGVCVKYRRIRSLETILSSEDQTLKVAVKRIYELKQEGPKYFELSSHRDDYLKTKTRPAVIDYFVVLPLVAFSVIVLASFWHMLC